MKPPQFHYEAPRSVEEAVSLLAQHGDEAKILAGGQSLVPLLALRLAVPSVVIDINRISELEYLDEDGAQLTVGALARHRVVEKNTNLLGRYEMFGDAISLIGHVAIRNRGTVLGSIAHADPAAEWPAIALALDGEFVARGPNGTRTIAADSMFLSFLTTTLEPDELLTEMRLRIPNGRTGSCFLELSRRHGDFAVVGVGSSLTLSPSGAIDDARVVLIGVADTVVRARDAEEVLKGEGPGTELFEEAGESVRRSINPTGDVHGSSEYRRSISGVLTRRALAQAAARANGGGHDV